MEMASVAVRMDLKKWLALLMLASQRLIPSARIVDDNNGVVDYHSQRHDEGSQSHRIDLYAESIEQAEGNENADWDGTGCHQGDTHGHQQQHYNDHGDDGDEKLLEEINYRVAHHLALVGDGVHVDLLEEGVAELVNLLLHGRTHIGDATAFLHLDTKDETLLAVIGDKGGGRRILVADGGDVLYTDDIAVGTGIDNHLLHIVNHIQRADHMNWCLITGCGL